MARKLIKISLFHYRRHKLKEIESFLEKGSNIEIYPLETLSLSVDEVFSFLKKEQPRIILTSLALNEFNINIYKNETRWEEFRKWYYTDHQKLLKEIEKFQYGTLALLSKIQNELNFQPIIYLLYPSEELNYAVGKLISKLFKKLTIWEYLENDIRNIVNDILNDVSQLYIEPEFPGYAGIIGNSPKMRELFNKIENIKDGSTHILIEGETGTGKELVAKALHNESLIRRHKPYFRKNCGNLSPELLESELFGHEKGAFTGAIDKKLGLFELANGGSIFLDEINSLPLECQVKLTRALDFEGEIMRIGGRKIISVKNTRVVAAANKKIEHLIHIDRFREDLFYRLNGNDPLIIPPLRNRREDIPLLTNYFISKYCRNFSRPTLEIQSEALEVLCKYNWPQNVRGLENTIRRLVESSIEVITVNKLPTYILELPRDMELNVTFSSDIIPSKKSVTDYNIFEKETVLPEYNPSKHLDQLINKDDLADNRILIRALIIAEGRPTSIKLTPFENSHQKKKQWIGSYKQRKLIPQIFEFLLFENRYNTYQKVIAVRNRYLTEYKANAYKQLAIDWGLSDEEFKIIQEGSKFWKNIQYRSMGKSPRKTPKKQA